MHEMVDLHVLGALVQLKVNQVLFASGHKALYLFLATFVHLIHFTKMK